MHSNLKLWLEHPVTKRFLFKITEERQEKVRELLDMENLDPSKLAKVAELKGMIKGLEKLSEIEELELLLDGEKYE